jgi:CubicO group peptidase (beta-lactamase class C family)
MSLRIARSLLLALLLWCLPAIAQLPSSQTKAVDALITSYISEHHVPGMSVAVVQQGRVVLAQGYGLADIENNVQARSPRRSAGIQQHPVSSTRKAVWCGDSV